MAYLDINDVKPDMKVVLDVCDAHGNVLLKQGALLTEAWIDRLKRRCITHIDVNSEVTISTAESEENGVKVQAEELQFVMKKIFTPVLAKPHMKALARSTYQYLKAKN